MKINVGAKIVWCLPFMPDQGFAVGVGCVDDLTVTYCLV